MLLWSLLTLLAVFLILLMVSRDLRYAALSLALASGVLAVVLFRFGAGWAAVLELILGAGVFPVFFLFTVRLTRDSDQGWESRVPLSFLPLLLILLVTANYYFISWLAGLIGPAAAPAPLLSLGKTFWGQRTTHAWGLAAVVLAGVCGLLALFREIGKRHKHE